MLKNQTLQHALVDKLENDIVFGVYPMGTRLMEDRVMQRYDAKRHAVRSAFFALKARGLLVHMPNRGVEVVSFTADDVDAIYELRMILETAAAKRTKLPVHPEISDQLEKIALAHQQAYTEGDYRSVFKLNLEFHQVQFSCCGNERLMELIEEHARIVQPIRVVKYGDVAHMQRVVKEHFKIIESMRGISQEDYVSATQQHLPASAKAFRAVYESRTGAERQRTLG